MNRIYLRFLQLFVWGMLCSGTVLGQSSYVESMLTHKVTVHYPGHTVTAHVEPVEKISVSSNRLYYWFSGNQVNITEGGYSGKPLNGSYEDLYDNKNLKESGNFEDGLKTGLWKSWTEEGLLINEFTFRKGAKNGPYVKYDVKGKVMEKGTYQDDLLNGRQEIITADSTKVVHYKQGKVRPQKSILPKFIYKVFPKKSKK
jgi:effector-binding domain-containing protein